MMEGRSICDRGWNRVVHLEAFSRATALGVVDLDGVGEACRVGSGIRSLGLRVWGTISLIAWQAVEGSQFE